MKKEIIDVKVFIQYSNENRELFERRINNYLKEKVVGKKSIDFYLSCFNSKNYCAYSITITKEIKEEQPTKTLGFISK